MDFGGFLKVDEIRKHRQAANQKVASPEGHQGMQDRKIIVVL
jgi:hypothetical protein